MDGLRLGSHQGQRDNQPSWPPPSARPESALSLTGYWAEVKMKLLQSWELLEKAERRRRRRRGLSILLMKLPLVFWHRVFCHHITTSAQLNNSLQAIQLSKSRAIGPPFLPLPLSHTYTFMSGWWVRSSWVSPVFFDLYPDSTEGRRLYQEGRQLCLQLILFLSNTGCSSF